MDRDFEFLSQIFDILNRAHLFKPTADERFVDFRQPEELEKIIDFTINNDQPIDNGELRQLVGQVLRHSNLDNHPRYLTELYGGYDLFALAGSWVADAINATPVTYEAAPIFTMTDGYVISKFLSVFGWEKTGDGVFTPGGSMANMYAIIYARNQVYPDINQTGMCGKRPLVLFTSEDSHFSLKKSAMLTGIGAENIVYVKSDKNGKMIPAELRKAIEHTKASGKTPFFVNATAGTTVLGSFDDVDSIADICEELGIWLNVDAVWGGSVALSPKYQHRMKGSERANSITMAPHKHLSATLQCSFVLVKDKTTAGKCLSASADYLFGSNKCYNQEYDIGDRKFQCTTKCDSFKLWLMFKARGMHDIIGAIDNSLACVEYIEAELKRRPDFRPVLEEFEMTNVCFWYIPKSLRGKPEDAEWWQTVYNTVPKIKAKLLMDGRLGTNFSVVKHRNVGNFFRLTLMCYPPPTRQDMDFIVDEIARVGATME